MRPLAVSLGFASALGLAWAPVEAAEPLVLLDLDRCDELDESEVRRVVAAELGAVPASASGDNVTHVTITCEALRILVRVEDPLSRKAVQRRFSVGLLDPRARGRFVSIAAAELVLASWAELQTNPTPAAEPEGPPPDPALQRAARRTVQERLESYEPSSRTWYELETPQDRPLRVVALASTRAFLGYAGTLYGGGARIGEERFRWLSWCGDLLLERGDVDVGQRMFSLQTVTAGGWLMGYLRSGMFTARLGPGLRLGVAQSAEQSGADGSPSLAPWGWPLAAASMSLAVGAFVLEVSGEAGYAVLPLGGGGDPAVLRDGWYSGQVGVGINFSDVGEGRK
jgi:hypothetical protein